MTRYTRGHERDELLADVAEMYYVEDLTQQQVARAIGITRSAVSRMLTEARHKGIVEITVHRPLNYDEELEHALVERFNLLDAHVLSTQQELNYDTLRSRLGWAAAQVLAGLFRPQMVCGVTWGTTVSATIDFLKVQDQLGLYTRFQKHHPGNQYLHRPADRLCPHAPEYAADKLFP